MHPVILHELAAERIKAMIAEARHVEELVSWTCRERLRFLWYRLRLTVTEMNYAVRRMTELRMRLP